MIKLAKIKNDKYYTPPELAMYCVEKTKEIIGSENITEYIEPSAGSGVFLDYLDKPYIAYDIEPEDERIIRQDYLTVDLEYKKGRCVIGNPPYGERNALLKKFYKKSIQISDYIVFILPISQYNNEVSLYEFDLIYSENLDEIIFSNKTISCCFNIYRKPNNGIFNKRKIIKLQDIYIEENRRGGRQINKQILFDYAMCSYGNTTLGLSPKYVGQYAKEMYIKINNEKLKDEIINVLQNTNWVSVLCFNNKGRKNITQQALYKYLKDQIPELQ